MAHQAPDADSRPRYTEVIHHDPAAGERTLMTSSGVQTLTSDDMRHRVADGPAVTLTKVHAVPKEAAEAYVSMRVGSGREVGRYLPAAVRRYLHLRYRGFCATPGCRRHASHVHHMRRYALDDTPGPDALVPLCASHGNLAHLRALSGEVTQPASQRVACAERGTASSVGSTVGVEPDADVAPAGPRASVVGDGAHSANDEPMVLGGLPPAPALAVMLPREPSTPEEAARAVIDACVHVHRRRTRAEVGSAGADEGCTANVAGEGAGRGAERAGMDERTPPWGAAFSWMAGGRPPQPGPS